MKKIFIAIFCGITVANISSAFAEVRSIVDIGAQPMNDRSMSPQEAISPDLPDPNNEEEVRSFFKKRFEDAAVSEADPNIDFSTPSSVNVVHTQEYYEAQENANKPLFQKMYEEALKALHDEEDGEKVADDLSEAEKDRHIAEAATRFFTLARNENNQQIDEPQIPTVGFTLPSGRRVLAPATEHIPYMLSYIDIQANGYMKVEDTIVVVANGQKFDRALQRVFPKNVYNQKNEASHIDLILQDVQVNGTPIAYMAEEIGDNIILKPKYKQNLEPGVYTYTFN